MKTIDLIYVNAGGGHRASATALKAAIRQQGQPWRVRLVDLFEVLDPDNAFGRLTGMRPEDFYNRRLARGWTAGMAQELKLLQAAIRLGHAPITRRLKQHWLETEPDLVVSLVPNFNRALCESLASTLPGVPFVTALTDLADHPPNFWIERGQDQHFICGSARAVEQALRMGHPPARVHATSGMILRPEFYAPAPADRRAERRMLGLDPDRPTGLVLFGGHGSKAMLKVARQLPDTQLILVCGHNRALAAKLQAMPARAPRLVLGFTSAIPHYMDLADFFVGKPGPGSISEAVQRGLPVVIVANAWTMPQERFNAQWVREHGVGIVHDSYRTIGRAVQEMAARIDEFRANVSRVGNRAVFEVPGVLETIMLEAERGALVEGQFSAARLGRPRFQTAASTERAGRMQTRSG
ncbi:glycosyltransferase [Quisquiliibacterium transsilvanicum]|uniref:UDP-N-acetylglucosamine:LPS N-acetylglucosamine transferase n=1 Tax=Quisquiliibacterium transsilvanicum TaxID=1549638 RepID=A0A7W8HGG0_9BURK|nr:glycosyltransferase [Quisquiliibacterium transsilvanicum]MBB5271473.1 UDP-N-acetylglucosamine:LPS N-acetylglucosamine transferase [Quisquiliibacterium transsilvanicum]